MPPEPPNFSFRAYIFTISHYAPDNIHSDHCLTLHWSDQIYYFLCEQETWWKSQYNDCLILNGLIAENITRGHHEKSTLS